MIKFNGTAQKDKEALLYYSHSKAGQNFFKVVTSTDGFSFADKGKYVIITDEKQKEEKTFDWKSFRIAKQGDQYILTYIANTKSSPVLMSALSTDLIRFKKMTGDTSEVNQTATIVPDFKHKDHFVMYHGENTLGIAYSSDLSHWKADSKPLVELRKNHWDEGTIEVGNAY